MILSLTSKQQHGFSITICKNEFKIIPVASDSFFFFSLVNKSKDKEWK